MKKLLSVIIATIMIVMVLSGCSVKTTMESKYADNFADNYVSNKIVDKEGNVQYKFQKDEYEKFVSDYYEKVKEESRLEIKSSGQYSYYNPEITEVIVGIKPETYNELGEKALKVEAQKVGETAIKYQRNLKNPKNKLTVIYRNANTSQTYFAITVTA